MTVITPLFVIVIVCVTYVVANLHVPTPSPVLVFGVRCSVVFYVYLCSVFGIAVLDGRVRVRVCVC